LRQKLAVHSELCNQDQGQNAQIERTERSILKLYKNLRESTGLAASHKVQSDLSQSIISDLSEASNSTTGGHEKFYARWESILYRPDDYPCYINARASWMIPQGESDANLQMM